MGSMIPESTHLEGIACTARCADPDPMACVHRSSVPPSTKAKTCSAKKRRGFRGVVASALMFYAAVLIAKATKYVVA